MQIACASQQQDLQLMSIFDVPQLPAGFPPARSPFDDHFSALWPPAPEVDPPIFPPGIFSLPN